MRNYVLLFCFIIEFGLVAQSLKIHQQDYYHASAGEECISKLFVENVTGQDLEVFISRNQVPGTTRNYMCWSACHSPSDGMTSTMLVPANRTVDNFSGHILSMPADSTVVINYCFNLLNTPNQSVCVDVLYTSSSDYLGAETVSQSTFSVYPNPASDDLTVNFEGAEFAEFILYDVLGNQVYARQITNATTLNLTHFKPGLYFCVLTIGGARLQKKLFISD